MDIGYLEIKQIHNWKTLPTQLAYFKLKYFIT